MKNVKNMKWNPCLRVNNENGSLFYCILFVFLWLCIAEDHAVGQNVPPGITFVRDTAYRTGGSGNSWKLDYAKPTNPQDLLPAVVVIHGGGWIEGDKSSYADLLIRWAQMGFFAASINYRLANSTQATFPEAIGDCKNAVRWLRANATQLKVDKDRIAVYGSSAGGHLAMMLSIFSKDAGYQYEGDGPNQNESSELIGIISDSGVVNLNQSLPENNTLFRAFNWFLGGSPPAHDVALKASADTYADEAARFPPWLMLYGTADTQVPIYLTDNFVNAMQANGHSDLTYLRYQDVDHCPFFTRNAPGTQKAVDDFLIRVLNPELPTPTPTPTPTSTSTPTPTPDPSQVLFDENFESGSMDITANKTLARP